MKHSTTNKASTKSTLASRKEALRGIEDLDPKVTVVKEVATKGTDLVLWLVKGAVVLGVGYYIYTKITGRFIAKLEVSNYPPANITTEEASSRADIIYNARSLFGIGSGQFDTTSQQLAGLNYNGFVRLYNAFGHRTSYTFSGDMDLIAFFQDQFTADHLSQLSVLLNGAFFKNATNNQEQLAIQQTFFPSVNN